MNIKSKCGKYDIIIDDEDYQKIMDFAPNGWEIKFTTGSNNPYVLTRKTVIINNKKVRKQYYLHRLIMGVLDDQNQKVDHKFTNTLDNRKSELRLVTCQENSKNRTSKKNSASKYLGVSFCASKRGSKKYRVNIKDKNINHNNIHLGYYYDEESAGYAYNLGAIKIHGEYANLNEIDINNIKNFEEIKEYIFKILNKLYHGSENRN